MKLYLIRHGETDFNKNKIPQGQEIDASLNETGIEQARVAGESLPGDIDFIISSPLKRASETAEILNRKLNKNIEFNNDIRELKFGSLAGRPWPEIVEITGDKDIKEKDDNLTFDYSKFDGETAEDLRQRVARFISEAKEKYQDKTILVTTHSGVIDTMHLLFPQKERVETKNGSIHEFVF